MSTELKHIPFFPLNIFLLPGEQLPLHIFEQRYRQLFSEAEANDLFFGLPYVDKDLKRGFVSVCKLVKVVKRYKTGESDVVIEAKYLAEAEDHEPVFKGKLYPGGFIRSWENPLLLERPSDELLSIFSEYIFLKHGARPQPRNIAAYRIVDIAASLALSNSDKVRLIIMKHASDQERFLLATTRYLNLLLVQERSFENGFILN